MKKFYALSLGILFSVSAFAAGHTVSISSSTNVTCFGACNGSATASVSGGVGPFTYSWSPGGGTAATMTGACAGSYTITVTDNSDMSTANAPVTIMQPTNLIATASGGTVCAGMCIPMVAGASGGNPVYTYNWTPGTFLSSTTTANPTCCPLTTITYTLTVTDGNGCVAFATTTVFVNPSPPVTVNSPTICAGTSAILTASGATTYVWSMGASTNPATVSPATTTTYTVSGTTAGCTGTAIATVTVSPMLIVTPSAVTNATCGACDGSISLMVTGGTAPYSYLWSNGSTVPAVSPLCAGAYTVTVTDAAGCSDVLVVPVSNLGGPSSAVINTINSSCTASTGEIHIGAITGGTSPYLYSIGGPLTTTTDYTGLPVGTVNVEIQDSSGCLYYQSASIGYLNLPVITLDSLQHISCAAASLGSIDVTVSGGTPGFTFSWSNTSTTEDLAALPVYGNYTLTVTDAASCVSTATYFVNSFTVVHGTIVTTPVNCGALGTATVSPYGGVPPYTFMWNDPASQTTAAATGLVGGYYNCIITDSLGCSDIVHTVVSSSCYNIIKGRVYYDLNSNCIQDAGEPGVSGKPMYASPGGTYGYTDANGDYTILTTSMSSTVSVGSMYAPYVATCPSTGTLSVNFSTPGDTLYNNNFGYYSDPSYHNLVIHPGWSSGSPGFTKTYWICYYNGGLTPQNATLRFEYDSTLIFVSATHGGVHYPATHSIEWSYTALPPASSWVWADRPIITFTVPIGTPLTTTLHSYFEILPIAGDAIPSNNIFDSHSPVTGSHDPNAKDVEPRGDGPNGNIYLSDSLLLYTVHFQNNGNDSAHFIVVQDTLSSFLDPATIVPGASSHPYTFDLSLEGLLTFRFDNIMLPDSTTDEPASHGYFNYSVKTKPGNAIGTVIENNAYIYFDYNEAIVTNTTINTIVDVTTGISSSGNNNAVKVYPNPFSDRTTFVIHSVELKRNFSFEMYDILGKKVMSISEITEKQFEISREGLKNGCYFYKITQAGNIVDTGKLMIN